MPANYLKITVRRLLRQKTLLLLLSADQLWLVGLAALIALPLTGWVA
jgi:hypothetical protein